MSFIISYMIRWVVQGWIISKIAKRVRKWMIKRYSLENKFKQSFTKSHEVDWENIKWFANFAKASYKKDNDIIRNLYDGYELYINEINDIKYVVLLDELNKKQYISIRGTCNSHNAMQDINFLRSKSFRLGIELHKGFHKTAEMIADDLISRLDKTWRTYVTGHSLGAAEALIVSWYLDYSGHNVAECINLDRKSTL